MTAPREFGFLLCAALLAVKAVQTFAAKQLRREASFVPAGGDFHRIEAVVS